MMNKNQTSVNNLEAKEFVLLLTESQRLAEEESITISDLQEMGEIHKMLLTAESIHRQEYIFHTATKTP